MQPEITQKLFTLNKEFYQSFGPSFAQTRRRIQPGARRVLDEWIHDGDWLDIGCGSGALAQAWSESGKHGSYTGIDFSIPLLDEAAIGLAGVQPGEGLSFTYKEVDLSSSDWTKTLERKVFDGALSLAVLHHVPSAEKRKQVVSQVAGLLKAGGVFILSCWQFQHSPRLLARVQPWEIAGIGADEVEEGDTLLDWRHQNDGEAKTPGLRYVHLFSREELAELAEGSGFEIIEEFESDGKGGKLGLYQVWRLHGS